MAPVFVLAAIGSTSLVLLSYFWKSSRGDWLSRRAVQGLLGVGLGVGELVDRGPEAANVLGDTSYFAFYATALLATTSMFVLAQESLWPTVDGFTWSNAHQAMISTPLNATDIVFGKVDADAQQELAGHFNVRSIPLLLFFKNGEVKDQIVATGFLRNGMINEEGAIIPEQFRIEGVVDRLERIADPAVLLAGVTLAVVASLETLLNLEATDKLDPQRRVSPPNRELVAQGLGNLSSMTIGGMPGGVDGPPC